MDRSDNTRSAPAAQPRSQRWADGADEWECSLGETAVHQQIIGQGCLGQSAPTPGVG